MDINSAIDVEWVQITRSRRIAYGFGAILLLLVFFTFVWFALKTGKTGFLDSVIMGGTLAGGGYLVYSTITGKERRKINDK